MQGACGAQWSTVVLVLQAPSRVSVESLSVRAAVPPGCVPGARPHSAPSPASLTRPCHLEPRLSHQRPAHALRGPGICAALPPASRGPHSSPEASAPSAPLLPRGAPAGPRRGSWRPSPESQAPVEGEGAERAERLSGVGRAPGEGDEGRTSWATAADPPTGGALVPPPAPLPPHAASAQALEGPSGGRAGGQAAAPGNALFSGEGSESHRVLQTPARDAGVASSRPPSLGRRRGPGAPGCRHLEPLGEGAEPLRPRFGASRRGALRSPPLS